MACAVLANWRCLRRRRDSAGFSRYGSLEPGRRRGIWCWEGTVVKVMGLGVDGDVMTGGSIREEDERSVLLLADMVRL